MTATHAIMQTCRLREMVSETFTDSGRRKKNEMEKRMVDKKVRGLL